MNRASFPSSRFETQHRAIAFQLKGNPPRHPHHAGRLSGGTLYKAGEPVVQTGIYEVTHDRGHRATHDVVMLAGDIFPACETCEQRVRFRAVRTAPYIFQDEDFENPEE